MLANEMFEKLFDVISVNHDTRVCSLIVEKKTKLNADAIQKFSVFRRSIDECFYVVAPHGKFKNGDAYKRAEK